MRAQFATAILQDAGGRIDRDIAVTRHFFEQNPWAKYVIEISLIIVAAIIARGVVFLLLNRWLKRFHPNYRRLADVVGRLVTPALAIAVVAAAFNLFPLSDKLLVVLNRLFYITILVLGIYCVAKVTMAFLDQWIERDESRKSLRDPAEFAVRVLFAMFGTMILLENLGISLTSVWTTLGVGSVAVALALQDTLSNFFAGVYLRLDRPIAIGDYIKLQSGEEGYVAERGWRSTRIQSLANHIIVIPNSKLATTILTNFSLPTTRMGLSIPISVNLESDPQRVEQILVEEAAQAAGKIPGLPADAAPSAQFIPGFGPNSLDFTLNCTVASYVDQYSVQHELRKRILQRLRAEKIEFPVPQRDVHVFATNGAQPQQTADTPVQRKEMSSGKS